MSLQVSFKCSDGSVLSHCRRTASDGGSKPVSKPQHAVVRRVVETLYAAFHPGCMVNLGMLYSDVWWKLNVLHSALW